MRKMNVKQIVWVEVLSFFDCILMKRLSTLFNMHNDAALEKNTVTSYETNYQNQSIAMYLLQH